MHEPGGIRRARRKLAIDVFGSPDDAMVFVDLPAPALDGGRPANLLGGEGGAELVKRHL